GVGDERCPLRAGVGMANVNVGDPRADLDAPCRRPHELRGRHDIVVHLGGEDRIELCVLRLPRDRLDLIRTPAHPGNNGQSESFRHWSLLSGPARPPPGITVWTPSLPSDAARASRYARCDREFAERESMSSKPDLQFPGHYSRTHWLCITSALSHH